MIGEMSCCVSFFADKRQLDVAVALYGIGLILGGFLLSY
ncbi:hypothetical protein MY9_2101 [Bacillus sp. JS]|nr:hypothetical protein MY9_2101 [Bacillus sp. JS]